MSDNHIVPDYVAQEIHEYYLRSATGGPEFSAQELAQGIWDLILADETKMLIFNIQKMPGGGLEGEHLRDDGEFTQP